MKRVQEVHERLQLDSPRAGTSTAQVQEAQLCLLHRSATVATSSPSSHWGNKASPHPHSHPHRRTLVLPAAEVGEAWRHSIATTRPAQRLMTSHNDKRDHDRSSSGISSDASSSSPEDEHETAILSPVKTTTREPEDRVRKKKPQVDILKLCEHLKAQGLGEPLMHTSSHFHYRDKLPPGVASRTLPRDPSTREKIKGRARLDYELANLRAVAFCEQQHLQAFRTASANLKNRDVRFVEEEEREQVHKDLLEEDDGRLPVDDEDDASSLVGSPLSREELFSRIQAWADDVDKALHRE